MIGLFNYKTLSLELLTLYIKYFIITSLVLTGFLCVSNAFDVIQKFKNFDVAPAIFIRLILFKIPFLLNEIAALISLISMLFFLRRLVRYNELIVILCNGVPLWRVVLIPVFASILLGLFFLSVVSPISTYSLHKFTKLDNKITKKRSDNIFLLNTSFLFFEKHNDENRIIKAESIDFNNKELHRAIILFIDSKNHFIKRIDAKLAKFNTGYLRLLDAEVITDNDSSVHQELIIETNLSSEHFNSKLTKPEMIIIWELPKIIDRLAKAGIPTVNYKIYYYKQLFKPLFMATMVMFGACFIHFNQRNKVHAKMIVVGLFMGLIVYFLLEIIIKMLIYNGAGPILAISLPIFFIVLMSNFVILHFHEA
jgi:lipopolysaccharide export system permease protein